MALGFGKQIGLGGLSDWIDPRRQALIGLGAGLAGGNDWSQGISQGLMGAQQGMVADNAYATAQKAEAQRAEELNQTIEFLRSKGREDLVPLVSAGQGSLALTEAMRPPASQYDDAPASIQEYKFYSDQAVASGEQPMPYDEWRKGSNQTVRAGLGQPIPLRNKATGETVPFMPMSDGSYMNPLTQTVADDTWEFDPAYIAAQRAQGGALGKAVAGAQFDLPSAKLAVEQSLKAIEDIRSQEKGMKEQFGTLGISTPWGDIGVPQQWTGAMPKSDKAKFQVAVQRGIDRSFMEAREALRGGGQITDFEGKKAETAISNMQLAIEKGDEAQFTKALNDFEQAIKDGYRKLEQQAGSLPTVGGGNSGAADPLGIR
jgi:hypothetical protein